MALVKRAELQTTAHIFVCVNQRRASDPLGEGCGARGEAVHAAVRSALGRGRLFGRVWLARSYCLGVCPKVGATAVVAPRGEVRTEVVEADADALIALALAGDR